jgi:hypothetical protein
MGRARITLAALACLFASPSLAQNVDTEQNRAWIYLAYLASEMIDLEHCVVEILEDAPEELRKGMWAAHGRRAEELATEVERYIAKYPREKRRLVHSARGFGGSL